MVWGAYNVQYIMHKCLLSFIDKIDNIYTIEITNSNLIDIFSRWGARGPYSIWIITNRFIPIYRLELTQVIWQIKIVWCNTVHEIIPLRGRYLYPKFALLDRLFRPELSRVGGSGEISVVQCKISAKIRIVILCIGIGICLITQFSLSIISFIFRFH